VLPFTRRCTGRQEPAGRLIVSRHLRLSRSDSLYSRKAQVDVEQDLVPVFLVGTAPYVIAANASRPYRNFTDIIAASKKEPGSIKYASVGIQGTRPRDS